MTNQDTSPEAVERLARHTEKACKCEFDGIDVSATLRALSAALEAKKATVKTLHDLDEISVETVQQLTAERDALKAELDEAVGALRPFASAWTAATASGLTGMRQLGALAMQETAGIHFMRARTIIARHQKEAGV